MRNDILTKTGLPSHAAVAKRAAAELSQWYGEHVQVNESFAEYRAVFSRQTSADKFAAAFSLNRRPGVVVILTHKSLARLNDKNPFGDPPRV